MLHAVRHPVRTVMQDERRLLFIGADRSGALLEVVVLDPEGDPLVIHAMPLRPKFYRYL